MNRQGIGGILKRLGVHIFTILIILLFLTRLLAYIFARKFARPIEILSKKTEEVAQGNLKTITDIKSNDEIGTLAKNFNHMIEGLKERDFVKETFGKYITKEIRDEILKGNISLNGELKNVTVLFADLRNFTPLVESTPPVEVAQIINNYFEEMASAIHSYKGLVIQFIGDEIEAVFGAPLPIDNHASLAVFAALEMRKKLAVVNRNLQSKGHLPLCHGVGIHTGQVLAANIGSPDRLSYALIGDTVNLASRIQELNKDYGTDILISSATRNELISNLGYEKIEVASIRGKNEPVELYKVL
jgi:adenylate cyclase